MIWCVEDDPSIREIIVYALNSTGLEAFGFEDGQIFWETLQERQSDLVLLDVMLLSLICIMGCLYDYVDDMQVTQLRDELRMAAVGTEQGGVEFLEAVNSDHYRLTWVTAEGHVVIDRWAVSLIVPHSGWAHIGECFRTFVFYAVI